MDSVLVVGSKDERLTGFLKKMGYNLYFHNRAVPLPDLVSQSMADLVLIDARVDLDALSLCEFLRAGEATKQVPIVLLAEKREHLKEAKERAFGRIELVPIPYSVGAVVSRIATQMRLRKLAGADEETASIGEINARLRELNARFMKQLEEAQAIQLSLVPKALPRDERYDLSVVYQPLEQVGGDWYYASAGESGKLSVQVADVTGHGLSAAFVCSMTKLAQVAAAKELPHELLREMNRLMTLCLHSGSFVTIFSYLYDPATGRLDFARGGHPPGLLLKRKEGKVQQLKSDGFAFGFFAMSEYARGEAQLEPGDVLLVYTDGLPEAPDRSGANYGYERPSQLLSRLNAGMSSAEILTALLEDFDTFRDGRLLKDDVTVIMLKRLG